MMHILLVTFCILMGVSRSSSYEPTHTIDCSKVEDMQEVAQRRMHLVDKFVKALRENDTNVFLLRKRFFPSNKRPAHFVGIEYMVNQGNVSSIWYTGWCGSSALKEISRKTMLTLSIATVTMALNGGRRKHTNLTLSINMTSSEFLQEGINDTDINSVLCSITPWVSLCPLAHYADVLLL